MKSSLSITILPVSWDYCTVHVRAKDKESVSVEVSVLPSSSHRHDQRSKRIEQDRARLAFIKHGNRDRNSKSMRKLDRRTTVSWWQAAGSEHQPPTYC